MNTVEQGIITLLRCAITGQPLPLPEEFRLEEAMDLIRSHSIVTLAYEGAVRCGMDPALPAMRTLFQSYCQLMLRSERQMKALEGLFEAFQERGICFLPLKGCRMKALYPRPELRIMGDADVLIRMEQYQDRIVPLMEELGYVFVVEGECELVWQNRDLFLELHRWPIKPSSKRYHAYFRDGWHLARQEEGFRYAMTAETEFLHLVAHFVKHFRGRGIGCRHVVDLWVYLRSHPELNQRLLEEGFAQLGLTEFYESVRILLACWFEDRPMDRQTEQISQYIFDSGNWGRQEVGVLNTVLKDSQRSYGTLGGKLRYLWVQVFPERKTLEKIYPILAEAPWLLPLMWGRRLVSRVFLEPDKVTQHLRLTKNIDREAIDHRRDFLRSVGLDEKTE